MVAGIIGKNEYRKRIDVANYPVIPNKNCLQVLHTSESVKEPQQFVSLPVKLCLNRQMTFWQVSQKKVFVLQCYVKSISIKPKD